MKFAFLLTQLEIGGAQVRVMQTATEMRRMGHEVDVFYIYEKRSCFEDEEKIILAGRGKPSPVRLLGAILKLYKCLRSGSYDALVTNTAPANIIGNTIGLLAGVKKRVAVQTQPPGRLSKILRLADKFAGSLGIYDKIVANSNWTYSCFKDYGTRYRKRLVVLHSGITPRRSSATKDEARKSLGIGDGELIIVNVGRLSKQKDQKTLIEAMTRVDGRLLIAGSGELEQDLRTQAADLGVGEKVVFLGEIPGEKIALALRAADIFAFSSLWETFGLALIEAAASGVPIVATDLDVSREVLDDRGSECAAFVAPGDANAFADAINSLAGNPEFRQAMGEKARQRGTAFSMDVHAAKLIKLATQ